MLEKARDDDVAGTLRGDEDIWGPLPARVATDGTWYVEAFCSQENNRSNQPVPSRSATATPVAPDVGSVTSGPVPKPPEPSLR